MIVIDPRRTETAELADFHLQVRPGRDAWLLAAMAAVLVDEALLDRAWLADTGVRPRRRRGGAAATCRSPSTARSAACRRGPRAGGRPAHRRGVQRRRVRGPRRADEPPLDARQLPREAGLAAHRQPRPARRAVLADVAGQPRAHQPAGARPGDRRRAARSSAPGSSRADPVQRDRRRDPHRPPAALPGDDRRVRQPGPLARRQPRMREAIEQLDVARVHRRVHDRDGPPGRLRAAGARPSSRSTRRRSSTSSSRATCSTCAARSSRRPTARCRSRRSTPASSRPPGCFTDADLAPLRAAAAAGPGRVRRRLRRRDRAPTRALGAVAPVVLYRTLGATLPDGAASAAALWALAQRCALMNPDGVRRAGFGDGPDAGDRLFDAILASPSGVVFTDDDWDVTWRRITTSDGLVHLAMPELLGELAAMADEVPPGDDPEWPFLLSAGERRSFTANTILRDPAWRKRDADGRAAHRAGRRRRARPRRRRPGPPDDEARPGAWSPSPSTRRCTPATSPCPTASASTTSTARGASRTGVAPERAHGRRGPRPVGRHAVAQVGAGPARHRPLSGRTPRRSGALSSPAHRDSRSAHRIAMTGARRRCASVVAMATDTER